MAKKTALPAPAAKAVAALKTGLATSSPIVSSAHLVSPRSAG